MFIFPSIIIIRNEQLRDGLLSLVHSYSLLENKLDRHEQRERQLGEIIKRGLQTLTKGQKIFEPVRGSLTRLDERISQIETALLNQDTKITEQQQKFEQTIASVAKWISSDSPPGGQTDNSEKNNGISNQIEDLAVNVKELRKDVNDLAAKYVSANESSDQNLRSIQETIVTKLNSTEQILTRFDEKMMQFYLNSLVGAPPTQAGRDSQWEEKTSKDLREIIERIDRVKSATTDASDSNCVDKDFIVGINNHTLEVIEEMRHEVLKISDKNFIKTTGNIKDIADKLEASVNELVKNDAESTTSAETFCESISANVRDVKRDLAELNKLEQMLVQMGDNVLSVKRGMEFNVHAITSEVSSAIKSNSKDLNTTINDKFDDINKTILSNHNGALANLTSKIETEISQVWRQIGIMYKEVSSSKDALNKLQDLTEAYVNGTFVTMDSMEGKVIMHSNCLFSIYYSFSKSDDFDVKRSPKSPDAWLKLTRI